jgi:hypothetical protein
MSVPLRKDEFAEENLTTADLEQSKRPLAVNDRKALEDRLNDDRMVDDGTADTRTATANDRTADDRTVNDQTANDRPGPVLAQRAAVEKTSSVPEVRSSDSPNMPQSAPLFPSSELEELRERWNGVQAAFVDEPRRAVEQADGLVASAMKRLAEVFAEERSKLEQQWDRGDNVSTEDLRVALQRYRSFFQRLLAV